MNARSHFGSRPGMLLVAMVGLLGVHAILFYRLHRAGLPLVVVSGLALLVIVKHLGLLGPLYGLLRRRFRIRAARRTNHS